MSGLLLPYLPGAAAGGGAAAENVPSAMAAAWRRCLDLSLLDDRMECTGAKL